MSRAHHAPDDLIESYLDGELDEHGAARLRRLAAADPELAGELELARRIRRGLRAMELECPDRVLAAVHAEIAHGDIAPEAIAHEEIAHEEIRQAPRLLPSSSLHLPPIPAAGEGGRGEGSAAPTRPVLTPLAAFAAALVLATGLIFFSAPTDRRTPLAELDVSAAATPQAADAAAVDAARRDVELAFAYLGQLGRTAETSVRSLAGDDG